MTDFWMPPIPLSDETDRSDAMLLTEMLHPAWHRQGACHGLTDLFFGERGESTKEAKAVCKSCPVLETCRDTALNAPTIGHGIVGGMSERERRKVRRARRGEAA